MLKVHLLIICIFFNNVSNNNQVCTRNTRSPRISNQIRSKHLFLIRIGRQWNIRDELSQLEFK
jgi:hypothetical protein